MNGPSNADVIVLGAGMVGVSTALHLQKRGRSVVLVDRRGAGEETSYGNTGIIQREGVVPYPFPRQIGRMAQYALNMRTEANLHWSALPQIAPWLYRYWQASTPAGLAATPVFESHLWSRGAIQNPVEYRAETIPAGREEGALDSEWR